MFRSDPDLDPVSKFGWIWIFLEGRIRVKSIRIHNPDYNTLLSTIFDLNSVLQLIGMIYYVGKTKGDKPKIIHL